jgi:hypothetical protein
VLSDRAEDDSDSGKAASPPPKPVKKVVKSKFAGEDEEDSAPAVRVLCASATFSITDE